ncbi:BrnT family toxin [uncultured Thiohalocapsa sp.]|uniref:BrnT family toxin n=1 Tax=uncultured Thiohalocapsa sp. TaxID=768990 RepID=UPI0025DC5886|nr:BrnT family toxin [uncultured Thiohalocapsa sp.]
MVGGALRSAGLIGADYGEKRLQSLGLLNDVVVFLCWVERQQGPHLISIRKAKKHERATYFKSIGY